MNRKILYTLTVFFCNSFLCYAKEDFSNKIIENAKKSVVTIKVNASLSADPDQVGAWEGTGFIINKSKGLILTNAHVSGRSMIGKHDIIFQDGTQLDAQVVYYDPWLDYAFLKTDPSKIPSSATQTRFSKKNPKLHEPVMIIGNNEGKSFSVHTGNVSGLNEIVGILPQHSIRLSLNTKGGSSGSPVINTKGEAIALNYAGDNIFAIGLHPEYIRYALTFIEKDAIPLRQHIGTIVDLYPLSQAVKHRKMSESRLKEYTKKFKTSRSNAIQVVQVLKGSPADGKLKNGDIILSINNKMPGPSLIELDKIMNTSKEKNIKLEILRDNKLLKLKVGLYNLEDNKIKTLISFNKGVIFQMDDQWSYMTGAPSKTLSARTKSINNYIKVLSANNIPLKTLSDVIKIIPQLIKAKYFYIDAITYSPYPLNYSGWFTFAQPHIKIDMFYESLDDPKVYRFNSETLEWKGELIK